MSAPPSKRQRLDSSKFDAPINSITEAMNRLCTAQDNFPKSSELFVDLIRPLQAAHIALTELQEQDNRFEASKSPGPAPSTSTEPLIAKFHPNLTRPFLNAFRSLDAKDFSLVQRVMDDIEAAMPKLDELVSFASNSFRSFRVLS